MIEKSVMLALPVLLVFLTACTAEKKKANDFDAKALLESKCASCHNLEILPETSADEAAPPIMAVTLHIYDLIEAGTPAEKVPASIAFVKDYVVSPSREKSFCDPKSLDEYGVMPSQKGKLSEEELDAIAIYMFEYYSQDNFLRIMKDRQELRRMAPGERVARQYGCISCHGITQKKMGPSIAAIAERYKGDRKQIMDSIRAGSQERWAEARHAKMPSFKQLTNEELDTVSKWIMEVQE